MRCVGLIRRQVHLAHVKAERVDQFCIIDYDGSATAGLVSRAPPSAGRSAPEDPSAGFPTFLARRSSRLALLEADFGCSSLSAPPFLFPCVPCATTSFLGTATGFSPPYTT